MGSARWGVCLVAVCGVTPLGCEAEVGEARPQLVIFVDTDAPLPAQTLSDASIADDATVDTLRIDIFDAAERNVTNHRDFVPSATTEWPLSFGIPLPDAESRYGSPVLLRLRLFRAKRARTETLEGQTVLEPPLSVAIDRLVRVELPESGVRRVGVFLSFDCLGAPASFADGNFTTCIDAAQPAGSPSAGIADDPPTSTRVGTTALAREVACSGAPAGKACIPGGFAVLGDAEIVGLGSVSEDAAPLLPMRISPFALDPTEMTVGEFRAFAGSLTEALPAETSSQLYQCNWSTAPADPSREDRAINCIGRATAAEVCALAGERLGVRGALPSEAQWEFAARGHGKGWRFPWGNAYPGCCVAATDVFGCAGTGGSPQLPVAMHPPTAACEGLGDLSPDGVYDLAGNVSEHVRDDFSPYGEGCWLRRGIAIDPLCVEPLSTTPMLRGGSFAAEPIELLSALRRIGGGEQLQVGFRCAYELSP